MTSHDAYSHPTPMIIFPFNAANIGLHQLGLHIFYILNTDFISINPTPNTHTHNFEALIQQAILSTYWHWAQPGDIGIPRNGYGIGDIAIPEEHICLKAEYSRQDMLIVLSFMFSHSNRKKASEGRYGTDSLWGRVIHVSCFLPHDESLLLYKVWSCPCKIPCWDKYLFHISSSITLTSSWEYPSSHQIHHWIQCSVSPNTFTYEVSLSHKALSTSIISCEFHNIPLR